MRRLLWLASAVVLPRVVAFPFTENLHGDAVARTWLAHRWALAPHVIGSFDQGGLQFGPLHLYLLAAAEWLWPSPEHAGRLLSLLVGCLTALPLHALARRLFDRWSADLTVVVFGLWGLHVQASTTSGSEGLSLLLVATVAWLAQWWLDEGRRDVLLALALALNLLCATRYDGWLLVPMAVALVWWKTRSVRTAAWLGAASSAFAAAWMLGNFADRGDPLYPIHYIDDFHRAWFAREQARWGEGTYRWLTLVFWPGAAAVTLTPPVALAAGYGLWSAWRKAPRARWLVLLVVVPALLFTLRATVLERFVPLARFTVKEVLLLTVFVGPGLAALLGWAKARTRTLAAGAAVAGLLAWTVWLGAFTYERAGTWENNLRPVSPVVTNPQSLMRVARFLSKRAPAARGILVVDVDPQSYRDLQVAYFSGFDLEHTARARSPQYQEQLQGARVSWVVRFEGGELVRDGDLVLGAKGPSFRGTRLVEVPGFQPPMHVYRRAN